MIQTPLLFDRILHGGDYNPDQWPEDVWDEDVRLMAQAKWNIATLPVFSWVNLQPDEETFTFDWLDRVLEKLSAGGVSLCLATPTGSVPAWMTVKYPDVLTVNAQGQRMHRGGRHIFCPNSPNYRRLATGIARQFAERYGQHPALRMWHVSNEYGGTNLNGRCYCPLCAAAFREWLEVRYGSLDALNQHWDTAFWGKRFTNFEQIEPPFRIGEFDIQGLNLDYDRFQSESLLNCYRAEAAVLRAAAPDMPVTTNLMGAFRPLDYHAWAKEMDVVAFDNYPGKTSTFAQTAFNLALTRGLREGQPWILMEQTPSQSNWGRPSSVKQPGVLRLLSYQAVAHGAESVMYFQWRRTRGGVEKFHGAVLDHAGTPEARVFREVAALGSELEKLGTRTLGGRVPARVAVLFDWESWWAIEHSSGPSQDLNYLDQCRKYFVALHEQGILCDIVSPAADLSGYRVVVAPTLFMAKAGVAERLEEFVKSGGTFLATYFSGIVDECHSVHLGGYPGPFRRLLGVWVEEVDALRPDESNGARFDAPFGDVHGEAKCGLLCERVHPDGAETLAVYTSDFYAGEPVFTRHRFGAGNAYYLASALEGSALPGVLREVCAQAGVTPVLPEHTKSLEMMTRRGPDGTTLLYLLNHSESAIQATLPEGQYRDLISDRSYSGSAELTGYGVLILQAEN